MFIFDRIQFGLLGAQQRTALGLESSRAIFVVVNAIATGAPTVVARALLECGRFRPILHDFYALMVVSLRLLATDGRRRRFPMTHTGMWVQLQLRERVTSR